MHSMAKDISSPGVPATPAMSSPRVLIAAGGTGGHVYPAIAIAEAIRELHKDADILFVGTKDHMEWEAVPKAGFDIRSIWISGLHRRLTLKNLLFPVKLLSSLVQCMGIFKNFNPHVVIACGGYVSGPVGWIAAQKHIPLILQEQNSFPGITTRLLARYAIKIFTAFADADHHLPEEKTEMAGNPTRKTLATAHKQEALRSFNFSDSRQTLLILGGSGGAKTINEAMAANIEKLHDDLGLQIIWQCGARYFDELHMELHTDDFKHLRLVDFLHNMPEAYAAADLVVSRAGALSCSELALTGKPSILIPSPNVAGDHQTKNANSMVEEGAAVLLKDSDARDRLPEIVRDLISNQQKMQQMQKAALKLARPHAAREIAQEVLVIAKEQKN